jgi:hypothetical protein
VGDALPFGVNIYDATGSLSNGGTVTLTVIQPDGTTAGPFTVTSSTVGVYSYTFTTTMSGRHLGEWTSTTTNAGGEPQAFQVLPIAPVLTVGEFKAHASITGTADDAEIAAFIASATAILEGLCGPIYPRVITGEAHNAGARQIWTDFAPIISVSTLTEMWGLTQYTLTAQPVGSSTNMFGYTIDDYREGRITRRGTASISVPFGYASGTGSSISTGTVQISYTAGRANPSANVQLALKELTRYLWQQVKGGPSSFQEGYSAASSSGLSAAMRSRLLLILGPEASRPLGIA